MDTTNKQTTANNNQATATATANNKQQVLTLNLLLDIAKSAKKEANSLNGALKEMLKDGKIKEYFGEKKYDDIRLQVMQHIAYTSQDNKGVFCAVSAKPIVRANIDSINVSVYTFKKIDWFTAIAQSIYRISKGIGKIQDVTLDDYYTLSGDKKTFEAITSDADMTEIEKLVKIDKYNKALEKVEKLKLKM